MQLIDFLKLGALTIHTLTWLRGILAEIMLKAEKRKPTLHLKEPQTLGEHIRKRRLEKGLLQTDLAVILKVSEDSISKWENNKTKPRISQLPKIIDFLGYELRC